MASSASSLVVPPGHTLASITSQLLSEVASGRLVGLEFSSELGSKDRVMVHAAAEEAGLEHESLGFRPRRHLYVQRQPAAAKDAGDGDEKDQLSLVARMGHIYLEGPTIDRYGSEAHPLVDDACRANRAARDGVHYHATLVHGSLVERLRKERPPCLGAAKVTTGDADDAAGAYSFESELVDFLALRLTTPVREFGVGRATAGQHTAYYRVLQWSQLNDLRGELGLPPVDLHVTVGFKAQDVHGVAKNRWTLCDERRTK